MVTEGLKARFRAYRDKISITCKAEDMSVALATDPESFDLILLDLHIPGTNPIENVSQLKEMFPEKPIVILTSEESTVWEDQMCESGVQAYLSKREKRKKIRTIIEQVAAGEDFCKKRVEKLKLNIIASSPQVVVTLLKPNEKAILTLFTQEKSMKEIANEKFMTESAIAKVMSKLRKQYKVKTNTGLIRFVTDHKLL